MIGHGEELSLVRDVAEIGTGVESHGRRTPTTLYLVEELLEKAPWSLPFQSFSGLYLEWVPGSLPTPAVFVENIVSKRIYGRWYGYDSMYEPDVQRMDPHADFIPLFKGFDFPCKPNQISHHL